MNWTVLNVDFLDKKILNFAAMKSSKEIFDLIYEAVKTENDETDLEAINSAFCDAIKENNRELTEHLMLEKNANINMKQKSLVHTPIPTQPLKAQL